MMEWKDTSNYRRGERGKKEASGWGLSYRGIDISVHRHIHYPEGTWLLSIPGIGENEMALKNEDITFAKEEAIGVVLSIFNSKIALYEDFSSKLIITKKRKVKLLDGGIHLFIVKGVSNPCECGSKVYHYEDDGKEIIGVCNACDLDIYVHVDYNEFDEWKYK